ncbi:TetR/AcrR family transcriptional regulator [Leptospira terpstrae]|uniref:Transcriptional regulator, TetR family n=1 Tax=Leptospira terpstrae serovar Hualin str. LT 11-33 = ATCC 700639 TaxID=1257025 RepID=N1VUX2_9LEPT|nr:TetR/AcrR family transcriptional regulator [Leptospira terpstrae]EMY60795.1 transcriptional regulator, TetR family [Leptospira terpstrae serovar Hualin str. LT 11-33 = ATCC 700639]
MAVKKKVAQKTAGRPRSEDLEPLVLKTTYEMLAKKGYHGFSIDDIVLETGVAKTTIYRRWPNKANLAMSTVTHMISPFLEFPREVPFEKGLLDQMEALSLVFTGKFGRVIATLIGAGQQDTELSESILENYLLPRRDAAKEFFRHAIESKQIQPLTDAEIDVSMDILYGTLYFRLLLKHQKPQFQDLRPWLERYLRTLKK